jgi:hypothetical protein
MVVADEAVTALYLPSWFSPFALPSPFACLHLLLAFTFCLPSPFACLQLPVTFTLLLLSPFSLLHLLRLFTS